LEKIKLHESEILSERSSGIQVKKKVFDLNADSSSSMDFKDIDERGSSSPNESVSKQEEVNLAEHETALVNFIRAHKHLQIASQSLDSVSWIPYSGFYDHLQRCEACRFCSVWCESCKEVVRVANL
jgi:hypothetical protein